MTVIGGDDEAPAVAAELAADFREKATERDSLRRLPHAEVERLSASGRQEVRQRAVRGGHRKGSHLLVFLGLAAGLTATRDVPNSPRDIAAFLVDPFFRQRCP
ncbi:hypothetical protein SAMN06272771_0642 [Streptomyces sp. Ag82_O1-12]|uniref:hypothetical protein n=1 Tax=unclassified Streptomyces TaxID=2593676 RepID=UPI000BD8D38C|nr:hypothetical protein [Streptomyces sp. Ag82_G6-1]SMQ14347.1 hypothetical protein SAMN06272771_0642 [Streptomyces sp. Ag82_O1-12]SOD43373.1 hypothetical protein SAMN06272727_0631 [Streptomyces sp. Ag82_G6-1]